MRLLPALLLFTACNGDGSGKDATDDSDAPSISGLYASRRQTENLACGGGGDQVTPIPFLRLTESGGDIKVFECRSETDCNSVETDTFAVTFDGTEWLGEAHNGYLSEQEGVCYMWKQERSMVFEGLELRFESREYDVFDGGITREADCADAWPTWNGRGGTCKNQIVIVADRVAD